MQDLMKRTINENGVLRVEKKMQKITHKRYGHIEWAMRK